MKFNRSFARTLRKYPDANCTGVSKAELSSGVVSHVKRYAGLAEDGSNNVSSADGAAIEQKVILIRHAEKFKYPKTETEKEAPNSTLYNLSQCGHERADWNVQHFANSGIPQIFSFENKNRSESYRL